MGNRNQPPIHKVKTFKEFQQVNQRMEERGYVALDLLKPGGVRSITLGETDPVTQMASDMSKIFGGGEWGNGPLQKVAWGFDDTNVTSIEKVFDNNGGNLGLGYIKWGPYDNIPNSIPVLAQALPYTAAPLRYIADLTSGLGPKLMYRFDDGQMCEYKYAGERLQKIVEELEKEENGNSGGEVADLTKIIGGIETGEQKESPILKRARQALTDWNNTWYGYETKDSEGETVSIPGARDFLDDNNLNLHLSQCEQDDVMLDIYFPTIGFNRGRKGVWDPRIVRVDMLPAHSCRLEVMNEYKHINHVYFSDKFRTKSSNNVSITSADEAKTVMYPAAMPQHLLSDLRYLVDSNKRKSIKSRPLWVVCPTYYPSGQKPYYPQPAWWSVFTSKAFDFSSTILYDKAKARENSTSWGRIIYISLDYLDTIFSDEGYKGNKQKQEEFMSELEASMENFLQQRENNGKMMRQFMWTDQQGKDHHNVEIVDVKQATKDAVSAGKDELELSTSPIFLALQVDPRLVGVPMVTASNGGTALREMHLLKQQQLNVKQQLYLQFLNTVCKFNKWDSHAVFVIVQQTLTTLDNSKTGTVDTIAGEKA